MSGNPSAPSSPCPLLKPKILLVLFALCIAHLGGGLPFERPLLRLYAITVKPKWRRVQAAALAIPWHQRMNIGMGMLIQPLDHLRGSLSRLWSNASGFAQASGLGPSQSADLPAPSTLSLVSTCSQRRLNKEYMKLLLACRRQVSSKAPALYFDPVLFQGSLRFCRQLEAENVLRHDPRQPCAEIAGSSTEPLSRDPVALALSIYTSFSNSPHHASIQADEKLNWVSASSTSHKFIVRFNYHSTRPDE